jgi:hypothetical protein
MRDPTAMANPVYGIIALVVIIFMLFIWVRIVGKTGNSKWLGLLMVVPLVNIIFMIWLAFSAWPVEKK